jgi:tetratricopeptide (TPR) repeat protein
MRHCVKIILTLILLTQVVSGQASSERFRYQADLLIKDGRYREAIDQLNKYISANPQSADGYYIRGLCYEKTTEYQYAVLDLRRAIRLDPANTKFQQDLNRIISVWHSQLYRKIEGHNRDIAIDPTNPYNYLEIGKSYRWLEEWERSELWYDEYLKRDDTTSPDEIIRYTEILARNGSIAKGERILNKYVERYPDDWRLWSRYGYFSLWLNNSKTAEDAFNKALTIKPFFKEAEDGLDLVKNQAYLFQYQQKSYEKVHEKIYSIDNYYEILNKKPENIKIRFELVNELIKANRYEEAYQQLQILQLTQRENEEFIRLWRTVVEYRDNKFNDEVAFYTSLLKNDPTDKNAVIKLAEAYSNLLLFDSAIEVISEYLEFIPEDQDLDIRFLFAKYCAWNYEWEKAISQLNKLLKYDPDNLDYQLLYGQIGVWTVLDLEKAEEYLLNVAAFRPNDIHAYITLASMYLWKKDFFEARMYIEIAKSIAPNDPEMVLAENNYNKHLSVYEKQLTLAIKTEAGRLATIGDCRGAREKYELYFSKIVAPTYVELMEYADIVSCAQDYEKAIEIYDNILNEEFNFRAALLKARNHYYNKSFDIAVNELGKLFEINPEDRTLRLFLADAYLVTGQPAKAENFYRELLSSALVREEIQELNKRLALLGEYYVGNRNLGQADDLYSELLALRNNDYLKRDVENKQIYLADAYVLEENYGRARDIYEELLFSSQDTSQIRILKQRISWLPPTGFMKFLYNIRDFVSAVIPTNYGLAPFTNYYADNQNFKLWSYGSRIDGNVLGFIGLGVSWENTEINSQPIRRSFNSLKGTATINFSQYTNLSASFGLLNIQRESNKTIGDLSFRFEMPDLFSIVAYYNNNDARLLLYSPSLITIRLKSEIYRLAAYYDFREFIRISGFYSFNNISDGNDGNDLQLRLGKRFLTNSVFGYEYYFSDFSFISPNYYSPQNFYSHSLWGEYSWQIESKIKGKVGGKIGYVPVVDFTVSEIFSEAIYNPFQKLIISARLGFSNSSRYDSGYRTFSASISAYWNLF